MYIIDGKRYDEDPARKLGSGSEGAVYEFEIDPTKCVKVFHEPDPSDPDATKLFAYRGKKILTITGLASGLGLPAKFKLPEKPAYQDRRTVNGFLMGRVPTGFVKVMELLKTSHRVDNDIDLAKICVLFANIFEDVALVHAKKLVIGDINIGCVLVNPTLDTAYVDCDSWSYPGFPCLATTELFCHPDLYANLTKGGKLVQPQYHHDRFAFMVMFVLMALHGAHPFRMGTHKIYHSLQERAQNGVTILDADVDYPTILPPRASLSDDLLHAISEILKRKTQDPLNTGMLRTFADELQTCTNCGLQFHKSRHVCPRCNQYTVSVAKLVMEALFKTKGRVLFAQVVNDRLRLACRVNNRLEIVSIDSQKNVIIVPTNLTALKGARYRFFENYIVVCEDPYAQAPVPLKIYKIDDDGLTHITDTTTGVLENSSALFDTSGKYLYRTAGNTLLCARFFGKVLMEEPVAAVHRNQTWFTLDRQTGADRQVVFGYDRALRDIQWFMIVGNGEGENFNHDTLDLPLRPFEKMEDFAVYFNRNSVLLVRKTKYQGIENVHYSIIDLNDKSIVSAQPLTEGDPGFEYWREIDGKLYQSSSIVHISGKGLVKQDLGNGSVTTVDDTESIVFGDRILRFGKILVIVRANAIVAFTS